MLKALTVIALLVGTAVYAVTQESARCSLANTAGMWAFQNHGKTPNGEFNGVGTIHIAKDGTITGRGWITVAGSVSSEVPLAGTTTVSAGCTSTGTFQNSAPYHCVIFANHTKMWCVYEAPQDTTVLLERIAQP